MSRAYVAMHPIGRIGKPDEVAAAKTGNDEIVILGDSEKTIVRLSEEIVGQPLARLR